MKKSLLIFLLALLSGTFSLFAQTTSAPAGGGFKPDEGSWGFTGGVSGLSNISLSGTSTGTLGFRYILSGGLVARLSLDLATSHVKSDSTGLTGQGNSGVENILTVNAPSRVAISIGISKSWEGTDRLDPYVGVDLRISNAGGGKTINRTQVNNADSSLSYPSPTYKNGDYFQSTTKNASGISIGILPCVGFNYFIAKHFALGAEFGWGFGYTHTSGGSVATSEVIGGVSTSGSTSLNTKVSNDGFGTLGGGSVTFTVFY